MDRIDRQAPTEAAFDGITYEMLIFNDIEGVLKLEIDEAAGEARYITDGYSPLPRMFPTRMPKKAVVQVLKSLLGVWVNLDEYMIPRNELLMELSDVFINEESGEVKWICGLQKESRSPIEKLRLFMMELVNVMEGNPEKNQENMITLLKYVKGVKRDNLDQCREMADALLLQDIAADSAEAAAAEDLVSFGIEMPETENAPEFSYEEEPSEDGLDIMLPDAFAAREIAYIIRIRTGDEMAVVLDETLIGKSPDADFCIPDNRAVSRHHASILMDEGEYYLVDHNSTNSTYLNGMRLDPGDEYRLCHGDGFVLADEPFQFMIR